MNRVDEQGRAHRGSQLQLQIYVNRRTDELNRAIVGAIPELREHGARFEWVSPLEGDAFTEYRDADFLERLGLSSLANDLAGFWPSRGPSWDGLARVTLRNEAGVLLVEAKAHPMELHGPGMKASDPDSRARIARALAWTQGVLGVPLDTELWLGPHYQLANRLAHATFLRTAGVPAWLALVAFTGDREHIAAAEGEMRAAFEEALSATGLLGTQLPFVGEAFLEARPRTELAGAT